MRNRRGNLLASAERLCLWLGCFGLIVVASVYLDGWIGARQAVAAFEDASGGQIARQASEHDGAPVAVLNIARLDVEVPVFVGTDRRTLNRGAGIVDGTALPDGAGNTVISAHRDSFFRPLKDIEVGDVIELRALEGVQQFQVGEIFITDPLDVSVLEPADGRTLTLITCYPFHYVGFAPDRLIVRAHPRSVRNEGLAAD